MARTYESVGLRNHATIHRKKSEWSAKTKQQPYRPQFYKYCVSISFYLIDIQNGKIIITVY
jgi:hypothetical protein